MKWTKDQKTSLLLGVFIAALILSNLIGTKIVQFDLHPILSVPLNIILFPIIYPLKLLLSTIGGREIAMNFFSTVHVSVGILTVPVMFLVTDIIEEVYGKKKVREFVFISVISLVFVMGIVSLAVFLPSAERSISPESYNLVFGSSLRIILASIIAFVISQMHDMWAFDFWREKTRGRFLWLRNNLSTAVSQLIDSTLFMFIAFYQAWEGADAVLIISLIVPYWIFKILFALLDTPLAYLGVWWLKKKD